MSASTNLNNRLTFHGSRDAPVRCVFTIMAIKSFTTLSLATVVGCLASALVAAPAQSADLPNVPGLYTEVGPERAFSWAGGYVGVQAGAGQLVGRVTSGSRKTFKKASFAGGVYAGYNWQVSRVILGLEGDLTYLGHKKSFTHASLGRVKARNNWSVGVKGRIGLPFDSFMPYLSAGVSASDYKLTANNVTKKTTNISLNLGAGAEYALTDQIRLRADYSINGVNRMKKRFGNANVKSEAANHRLMVGLNYSF